MQHRSNQPFARELLHEAIRATGTGAAAQRAFTLYPSVESAALHLVEFFTARFPGGAEPLAHECLRAAFRAAAQAQRTGADEPIAFLVGLVREARQATAKRVGVENGDEAIFWVPFQESFRAFLERHDRDPSAVEVAVLDEPAPGRIDERMAAMMLAVRIMPAAAADRVCFHYLSLPARQGADLSAPAVAVPS